MAERGGALKRVLDFWAGVPMVAAAALCRRCVRPRSVFSNEAVRQSQHVVVLCFGAIGDLLLASVVLVALRRALPHTKITVVASKANAAALGLLPALDDSAVFAVTDILSMLRFVRRGKYDLVVDTSQWARLGAVVSAFSGASCSVGFATPGQYRHYAYDVVVPHKDDRHETENFLSLVQSLFPEVCALPELKLPPSGDCSLVPMPERSIFLHMWPSGRLPHLKEWPASCWGALARVCIEAGYTVVLTGSSADAPATEAFMHHHMSSELFATDRVIMLAGKCSLSELASLMQRAAAVVSVNTGIMHLAALCGAPTVGLHGPTNPRRWGPVGPRVIALLPPTGHCAYLNLGFEYPPDAEPVLSFLPVRTVLEALRELGLPLPKAE